MTKILEREPMEREMQDQFDLLSVTLESITDAVVVVDDTGCVQMLNPTAQRILGWTAAEAKGRPAEEVVELRERRSDKRLSSPACTAIRDGIKVENTDSFLLVSRDRRRMSIEISAAPIPYGPGEGKRRENGSGGARGCVLVFRDVSEARQLADRMSYHAHHDALTGLPNRILLVDRLEQGTRMADRNSDRMAVMFLDLDNFKEINDAHGSIVGDELLKEASFRLREALRESDTVCRLGGDEFVVMLPGVKLLEEIDSIAKKLVIAISHPFQVGHRTLETSCSLGISIYPQDGSDVGTLMRLADGAMHEAKRNGRNQYIFAKAGVEPTQFAENPDTRHLTRFAPDPYDR